MYIGNGTLLQYFLPGKLHGQRSLAGCSPQGLKESDKIEHAHIYLILSINCSMRTEDWTLGILNAMNPVVNHHPAFLQKSQPEAILILET